MAEIDLPQGTDNTNFNQAEQYQTQENMQYVQNLNETIQSANQDANSNAQEYAMTVDDVQNAAVTQQEVDAASGGLDLTQGAAGKVASANDYAKMLMPQYSNLFGDTDVLKRQDLFPTFDQPIRVGQYQGKVVGSVPIFAAAGTLFPYGIAQQRDKQLAKAAKARAKAVNQAMKLLDIDTVSQFQGQMNKLRKGVVDKWAKRTNNHFELLMDMNNPAAREFHEEIRELQRLDEVVTDGDVLAEAMLTEAKNGTVPKFVIDAAAKVREGGFDLDKLMTPDGMQEWGKHLVKLQQYQNTTKVLGAEAKKMSYDIMPSITEGLDAIQDKAERQQLFDLYQQRNLPNYRIQFLSAIRKYIPEDRIRTVVEDAYEHNNLWDGGDRDKAIEAGIEYIDGLIGDQIQLKDNFVNTSPSKSVSIGGDPKAKTNPYYVNMNDKYNENKTAKPMSRLKKMAVGNSGQRNVARATAMTDMGLKVVRDGSKEYKGRVETSLYKNLPLDFDVVSYNDLQLQSPQSFEGGEKRMSAQNWVNHVVSLAGKGKNITDQEKNTYFYLTGETFDPAKLTTKLNGTTLKTQSAFGDQSWVYMAKDNKAGASTLGDNLQVLDDDMIDLATANATNQTEKEKIAGQLLETSIPHVMFNLRPMQEKGTKAPTIQRKSENATDKQKRIIAEMDKAGIKGGDTDPPSAAWTAEFNKRFNAPTPTDDNVQIFNVETGLHEITDLVPMYVMYDMSSDGAANNLDATLSSMSTKRAQSNMARQADDEAAKSGIPAGTTIVIQ